MAAGAANVVRVTADGISMRALLDRPGAGSTAAASGDGPLPIVVLHGFTGRAESMEGVAARLATDRVVARLDLVGHGESDAPDSVSPYSMEACVRQVEGAIRALGFKEVHLLGYSMGGRAALATALAFPERFASLTLVGATAGIEDAQLRRERIASDVALAERIEREGLEAFVDRWMALPLFASQVRLGPEALAAARAERLKNRTHGLANSLRGMGAGAQTPQFDRLADFPGPTLLVVGAEDAKFQGLAARLEESLRAARTAVVAESGHAVHLEAPDAFASVTRAFLGSADAAARAER